VIIPFGDEETHTYCVQRNLPYFEGDLKDLVDRHYQAAKTYLASNVVRITSDCPMFSEAALMYMLYCHEKNELDFTTNFTTCADGHDIDIYSMKLLTYLHKNSKEREHVSLDLKLDIEKTCSEWKTLVYKEFYDKSWFPKISIDTQEDFDRVNQLLNQRVVHVVPKATGKLN
jgi:spore coat polysaccharide biosynthesis protein SpsF